MGSFAKDCLQP